MTSSALGKYQDALRALPLVPVLRGISPSEALPVVEVLYEAGFRIAEVTLNSPQPFESITALAERFGDRMLIGAGTVTDPDEPAKVRDAGGELVISPHYDRDIVLNALDLGMIVLPGVMSPSECLSAQRDGAHGLKMFPCEAIPPAAVRAVRAVLPPDCVVFAVGGIGAHNMKPYLEAGASGFGIGSSLYKPGKNVADVRTSAEEIVAGFRADSGSRA